MDPLNEAPSFEETCEIIQFLIEEKGLLPAFNCHEALCAVSQACNVAVLGDYPWSSDAAARMKVGVGVKDTVTVVPAR